MSSNKLAYWEAKGDLASSFCRPDHLNALWSKLRKNRVVDDDDASSSLLHDSRLSHSAIGWSNITPGELCDSLQEEHRARSYFLTSTSFSVRAKQRLRLLELFYGDIARYTQSVVGKAQDDDEGTITPTLDTVLQGLHDHEQKKEDQSPEQRFMMFAVRSAITIMFSFLKQAGRSSDPEIVQTLLEDANEVMGELPLACLRKLYHGSSEAAPDNWLFGFQHAMRFLEDVCRSSTFPTRTREVALVLRARLAATTGSLKMMLDAVFHMLQASDLDTSILAGLTDRFAELRVISKTAEGSASADEEQQFFAMPAPAYLAGPGKHPQRGTPYGKYQIPAILLSHLSRLSPPVRSDQDDVQVYGWGEEPNFELGFQRARSLSTPSLCSNLSQLNPLHITLASKATFVIDNEGKLWSCGPPTSRLLGHEGHTLKLVSGLENERFVQVAAIDHVLALTTRGEVYSWGSNSYAQLGRNDDPIVPTKITRGFGRSSIVYVAVGGQHSAAVSEDGVLYTWGRGSYGRLGHGTSDDVAFPQPVLALKSKDILIATVACGIGDAHTLALSRDGVIYAFGDGDYGKLGLGSTERTRVPVAIPCDFDGTKVKQVWCGRQISACLTEGGALYTWGNASGGALGNGESYGAVESPARILADHVIKSAFVGFQRGLALTQEGEVYIWGVLGSPSSVSIPHPLPDLTGKNITHVTAGPSHIALWSGDVRSVSHSLSPFTPSANPALLEAFARLLEQFAGSDITQDEHATAAAVSTCCLLERTFQVASRNRLGDISSIRARLRQPLLDLAVGTRPCPDQLRTAARFCVLQGWDLLDVPDNDRQLLLESITSIVFRSRDPPPTAEEEAAARQMLRTRWKCLMPMKERLRWLSRLLPESLASTQQQQQQPREQRSFDSDSSTGRPESRDSTATASRPADQQGGDGAGSGQATASTTATTTATTSPTSAAAAATTAAAAADGGGDETRTGHQFMVSVIVNSLFQQGVVEQAVNAFFNSPPSQQEQFLFQADLLLSSPLPSPALTPSGLGSARSSSFDVTAGQQQQQQQRQQQRASSSTPLTPTTTTNMRLLTQRSQLSSQAETSVYSPTGFDESGSSSRIMSPPATGQLPPSTPRAVRMDAFEQSGGHTAVGLATDLQSMLFLLNIFVTTMKTRTEQVAQRIHRRQDIPSADSDDILLKLCHRFLRSFFAQLLFEHDTVDDLAEDPPTAQPTDPQQPQQEQAGQPGQQQQQQQQPASSSSTHTASAASRPTTTATTTSSSSAVDGDSTPVPGSATASRTASDVAPSTAEGGDEEEEDEDEREEMDSGSSAAHRGDMDADGSASSTPVGAADASARVDMSMNSTFDADSNADVLSAPAGDSGSDIPAVPTTAAAAAAAAAKGPQYSKGHMLGIRLLTFTLDLQHRVVEECVAREVAPDQVLEVCRSLPVAVLGELLVTLASAAKQRDALASCFVSEGLNNACRLLTALNQLLDAMPFTPEAVQAQFAFETKTMSSDTEAQALPSHTVLDLSQQLAFSISSCLVADCASEAMRLDVVGPSVEDGVLENAAFSAGLARPSVLEHAHWQRVLDSQLSPRDASPQRRPSTAPTSMTTTPTSSPATTRAAAAGKKTRGGEEDTARPGDAGATAAHMEVIEEQDGEANQQRVGDATTQPGQVEAQQEGEQDRAHAEGSTSTNTGATKPSSSASSRVASKSTLSVDVQHGKGKSVSAGATTRPSPVPGTTSTTTATTTASATTATGAAPSATTSSPTAVDASGDGGEGEGDADASTSLIDVMYSYAQENNLGLSLPRTHLVWRVTAASLVVLARHLGLTPYLQSVQTIRDVDANPLLAEVVKVAVLMQPHVMRLKQELRMSDADLRARTHHICMFLLTHVQPTSSGVTSASASAAEAPEADSRWHQSRARVSVTAAPPLDPQALSTRVNLDSSEPFDELDEQGRQAVEDLQSGLEGHDRETLAQNAPSHPWFMLNAPQQTSLRAIPKELAELIVSFLRQPFALREVREQLVARSALAQSRIKVLRRLCNLIELPITMPVRYQLLCGLLDPRANPYPFMPLGRYMDGISCAAAAEKRELTEYHTRVMGHILELLQVSCSHLLRDLNETGEASTLPLRMLHLCQNLLIQPHEPPALEQILTSDAFHALADVCFRVPSMVETQLHASQRARSAATAAAPTASSSSSSSSAARPSTGAPSSSASTALGGGAGSGDDSVAEGLALFDGIESIKVSTNSGMAGALQDPSPSTLWESNGRRGAHWVLIRTRPGTVVHRLSITPASSDSFAPRQVVVSAGTDPANLTEVRRINCSQALDPNEDIVILDRARQHYPYIRLDVSSWGINVRLRRVSVQSLDLASLRAHIAGKPGNRRVGRRLFKYLALSASTCVDKLSDTALAELVEQCRVALLQGADDHKASMLAVFRRMACSTRLQVLFCATPWLDMLLDLFRDATTTARIFVLRFMAAALPGLASESSKSTDVRMLIEQLMRAVSDFTDMTGTPENEAVLVELIDMLRSLHSLPGWRDSLNEVIVQDLFSLPHQRERLQEGTYIREEVRGVLGTLTMVGLEAPRFRIGATCEHTLRGTGTITELNESTLKVEFHAVDDTDGPLVLSLADAEKELSVEVLRPFDFMVACNTGHDRMAFRTLLFEAFSSWPDHILSQKMQLEMLQACKLFFRTPVAFDLFLEEQQSATPKAPSSRSSSVSTAVGPLGSPATTRAGDVDKARSRPARRKKRRKHRRDGSARRTRTHSGRRSRSRNASDRSPRSVDVGLPIEVEVGATDSTPPPTASAADEAAGRGNSSGSSSASSVGAPDSATTTTTTTTNTNTTTATATGTTTAAGTGTAAATATSATSARRRDEDDDGDDDGPNGAENGSLSQTESDDSGSDTDSRTSSASDSSDASESEGEGEGEEQVVDEAVAEQHGVKRSTSASQEDRRSVDTKFIETLLNWSVVPSPVRAEYDLPSVASVCSEVIQSFLANAPLRKPEIDMSACVEDGYDDVTASSNPAHIKDLLEKTHNTYWQSCTRQDEPWVRVFMKPNQFISVLRIYHDPQDASYMPKEVQVSVGPSAGELTPLPPVQIPHDSTSTVLLEGADRYHRVVQITIKQTHNGGVDTRIRRLEVLSGPTRHAQKKTSLEDLLAPTPEVALASGGKSADSEEHEGGEGGGAAGGSGRRRIRHARHDSREVEELLETLMEHHDDAAGAGDGDRGEPASSSSPTEHGLRHHHRHGASHTSGNDAESHHHHHHHHHRHRQQTQEGIPEAAEPDDEAGYGETGEAARLGPLAAGGNNRDGGDGGGSSANTGGANGGGSMSSTASAATGGRYSHQRPSDLVAGMFEPFQRRRGDASGTGSGVAASVSTAAGTGADAATAARGSVGGAGGERHHDDDDDNDDDNDNVSITSETGSVSSARASASQLPLPVAFVWGANAGGQMDSLFSGAQDMSQVPKPKLCTLLPRGLQVAKMCIQKEGVVVLGHNGALYASAHSGPLKRLLPHGPKVVDVAYGGYHTLVVTEDHRLLVCGTGKNGKLGLRDTRDQSSLVPVPGLRDVLRVACGRRHSAAVTATGQLYMWGCNHHGRLGLGDQNDRYEPTLVPNLPPVQMVACGDRHTLVLTQRGGVYSFGCGDQGRLGIPEAPHKLLRPAKLDFGRARMTRVICGCNSSAALTDTGQLYVWGTGRSYRLGTGSMTSHMLPIRVTDLASHKIVDASLGHEHGVAVSETGDVFVWGSNDSSQLGGATADAAAPRPLLHPELRGKGLNRVSCGSRAVAVWRDAANAVPEEERSDQPFTEPMPVPEDRLGRMCIEERDDSSVERIVEQVGTSPPLMALVAHLPDPEAQQKSVAYFLKAMRVYQARQLVTLWLSRGVHALEGVPWGPDRLLLVLIDLMRVLSVRAAADEPCRVISAAIHTLCGKHSHLSRVLVEICVMETKRAMPSSNLAEDGMVTDEMLLTRVCSLGLIRATIDCTISYSSNLSMLRLSHALASLWISNPANRVRQWVLARLNTLLHNGSRDFLSELRRLVHFREQESGHQQEEAAAATTTATAALATEGAGARDTGVLELLGSSASTGVAASSSGGNGGGRDGARRAREQRHHHMQLEAQHQHQQQRRGQRMERGGLRGDEQPQEEEQQQQQQQQQQHGHLRQRRHPQQELRPHGGDDTVDEGALGREAIEPLVARGSGGGDRDGGVGDEEDSLSATETSTISRMGASVDASAADDDEEDEDLDTVTSARSSNGRNSISTSPHAADDTFDDSELELQTSSHSGFDDNRSNDGRAHGVGSHHVGRSSGGTAGDGGGSGPHRHHQHHHHHHHRHSHHRHSHHRHSHGHGRHSQEHHGHHHSQHHHARRRGSGGHGMSGSSSSATGVPSRRSAGGGHTGRVLSLSEFASFNVSGSGHLNVCELSLLLLHRDVSNCYFQLAHTFAQVGLTFSHRFDYEATHRFLLQTRLHKTAHKPLFGSGDDEDELQSSVGSVLREFSHSLWATLEMQHQHETTLEKDGRILMRSDFNRVMCRVAAGLDLPPGSAVSSAEKPSWFRVYCTTSREFNRLVDRRPFTEEFAQRIKAALEGRGDEEEPPEVRESLGYLDNGVYTAQMDKSILHWKAEAPQELRLAYSKDAAPTVNMPRLTFQPLNEGHVKTSNKNTTVMMQSEASEENTWVMADEVLTSGMHYWTVRCDSKGSARRYVGVGVGKPNAAYPLGAARILSEGLLKSGTSAIKIPRGFSPNDIIGVFLDLNRNMVAFDVNGHKRGEIELPGLAPGEGVRPLVYLFYPGDRISFVYGLPLPACYRMGNDTRSLFAVAGRRAIVLRAAPSVDSSRLGVLPPASSHHRHPVVVMAVDYRSNREGVWLRLANPDNKWGEGQCWCLLRDPSGAQNLNAVDKDMDPRLVINYTEEAPPDTQLGAAGTAAGKKVAQCITTASRHNVRAGPSLDAMVIGGIAPSMMVYYTSKVSEGGGVWLLLDAESKERVVEPNMRHLDAYVLFKGSDEVAYFKLEEPPPVITEPPPAYPALHGIPVGQIKRRCFLLETLSSSVLSLASLIEFQSMETSGGVSLGLGGTQKSLQALQDLLLLTHKERLIKAVISRTMASSTVRVTITLNRVQIHRQPSGVAGIYGQNSVFAQACRELRNADPSVFLAPNRCWKVKFAGEGVDDAGGGYSESISEMCEELVNGSLTLLIPTPNKVQDSGDSRDVYLFNPAANSPAELELFEFLGVLIGIAIRTNNPISLPLAGPVWKQLTGVALTIADLREVDTDYVTTLEIIKSLSEEAFSSYGIGGDTPSAKEGLTYQVLDVPRLTSATRDEYVRKALHLRLHEFDAQVRAVRRGVARVVPLPLLSLLQPNELQEFVLGKQEFDLSLLQVMTRYKGLRSNSALAGWFWDAIKALTPVELSLFLRFVSGRTRLPRTQADFEGKHFVLQALDRYEAGSSHADSALPEAITCFFTLKIPRYSSYEVLLKKLRYAINNCKAIDTDNYARTTLPPGS